MSGERLQDHWSSGYRFVYPFFNDFRRYPVSIIILSGVNIYNANPADILLEMNRGMSLNITGEQYDCCSHSRIVRQLLRRCLVLPKKYCTLVSVLLFKKNNKNCRNGSKSKTREIVMDIWEIIYVQLTHSFRMKYCIAY